MPGVAVLRAGYEDVDVRYRDLPDGAEISYRTAKPSLAAAIHAWFDAQLRDHGADATATDPHGSDHTRHPER